MSALADKTFNPVSISTGGLIELAQKCRGLSLRSGLIGAVQSGDYQSSFKGRGMEYDESRLYQQGDDIRNIDWRVTARTGKPHTKLFCEERERPVHIWVDLRSPMFFATRGRFKAVCAAELASMFAWIAINQNDRVGGIVFSDDIDHELKPQRGKSAALRMINYMVSAPGWQAGTTRPVTQNYELTSLLALRRLVRPGSLVIMLSDFRGFDDKAKKHLFGLRQHNEVIMVHIYDELEAVLPPAGYYRLSDGEQELDIDTSDKKLVEQHRQRFQSRRDSLLALARSSNVNLLTCRTDNDPARVIREGLRRR